MTAGLMVISPIKMVYHYDLNTKKRNPRSYRRDDSHHNAEGNVSEFFAGLLGVPLALGGTAGVLFGGSVVTAGAVRQYQCNIGEFKSTSSMCTDTGPIVILGLISSGVSLGGLCIVAAIFNDYTS